MNTMWVILILLALGVSAARKGKRMMASVNPGPYQDVKEKESVGREDYFAEKTFVNEEVSSAKSVRMPKGEAAEREETGVAVVEEEREPFSFDLRQAVVYQTVLNNRYVDDIRN